MKTIVAKLIIGKEERELTWVNLDYHRYLQINGKPNSRVEGGFIALRFEPRANDDFFLEWMFADRQKETSIDPRFRYYKTKDGVVAFYENDFDGRVLFKYDFEEGVPILYREVFSNERGMEVFMVISAPIQKFRSKEPYIKQWYEKWTPPREKEKAEKEEEPRVVDSYYTDLQGNEEASPKIGDEIYLVIETKNMIGEIVDFDLSDHSKDFEYQGSVLKNDLLERVTITENLQKIKLKVIKPQKEIEKF